MENTEGKKLKFLHCSDIHLDAPFVGMPPEKTEERRREIRAAFMRIMEFVRDRAVDYVLMAGDLFETKFVTNTTAEILIREFRSAPATKFIIAPGKHDSYRDNPIYASGRLPENCYVFSSDALSRFDFPEDKVTIYGWAFATEIMTESPIACNRVDDNSRINIVCGYADVDGELDSESCPIASADIGRFGADYYAFGGKHERTEFLKNGGSMYSYCGSPECTGFDEPFIGGVKLLNVDYNDGELAMDGKHVSFGRLRFVTETIDITGVDNNNEITNRISKLIADKKYGSDTALRAELVGNIDPRFIVPTHIECDAFGLYFFDMTDKTMPLYNTEHFRRDMSVAGEVYRRLYPLFESQREEDRLLVAKAFRVALAALEGREIDL